MPPLWEQARFSLEFICSGRHISCARHSCGDADSLTMIRYESHRKKGELTMRLDVMLLITAILVALAVWTEVDKWRKRKSRQ